MSYEEFLDYINDINEISSQFLDSNGKQLVFAVKKGSDSTAIWKGTVRVACCKVDATSKAVDSYRLLTLKQFLAIFKALQTQTAALQGDTASTSSDSSEPPSPSSPSETAGRRKTHPLTLAKFSASTFLEEALGGSSVEECCICIERKPDLILPCTHSYCVPCIEQWNVNHKTCPVCRETVENTDDGWVISDGPDSEDIATQIQKSLMEIADN